MPPSEMTGTSRIRAAPARRRRRRRNLAVRPTTRDDGAWCKMEPRARWPTLDRVSAGPRRGAPRRPRAGWRCCRRSPGCPPHFALMRFTVSSTPREMPRARYPTTTRSTPASVRGRDPIEGLSGVVPTAAPTRRRPPSSLGRRAGNSLAFWKSFTVDHAKPARGRRSRPGSFSIRLLVQPAPATWSLGASFAHRDQAFLGRHDRGDGSLELVPRSADRDCVTIPTAFLPTHDRHARRMPREGASGPAPRGSSCWGGKKRLIGVLDDAASRTFFTPVDLARLGPRWSCSCG